MSHSGTCRSRQGGPNRTTSLRGERISGSSTPSACRLVCFSDAVRDLLDKFSFGRVEPVQLSVSHNLYLDFLGPCIWARRARGRHQDAKVSSLTLPLGRRAAEPEVRASVGARRGRGEESRGGPDAVPPAVDHVPYTWEQIRPR